MVALIKSSLRERQHYLIRQLANCIESEWERYLQLAPYEIPEDLGYVEGSLDTEKLIIENRCYQTTHFRKLHLELAQLGDRLDILHCVMFPRVSYELPIFGVDLVGSKAGIGAAIVDLSPLSSDGKLNRTYNQTLANLPSMEFAHPRSLPAWGNIFSDFCLFIQPQDREEEQLFLDRVREYLTIHCQKALISAPLSTQWQQAQSRSRQQYYCQQQQKNDKTRRVLEKAWGKIWTDRYMTQMLFDYP